MNFDPVLYGPLFVRDAQDVDLVTLSADPVDVTVAVGGSSWTIPVVPVLSGSSYVAKLRMREILSSVVDIPGLAAAGVREVPMVTVSAGGASMSFRAVYGSAAGHTPTQLAGHWLSWRDQVSKTQAWGRERLTFLAGLDLLGWQSGSYTVRAKVFFTSGDPETVTLGSGTLQTGCRYVTVDASYAAIAAAVQSAGTITAWDVSYSFSGRNSSGATSVDGYPLRLVLARRDVRVKEFIFCNSFGVEDRVYSSGRSNPKVDGASVAFLSGGTERELRNDAEEGKEVYSGHISSARDGALWTDFLKARDRHILLSGTLEQIVVDSHETDLQDNAIGSVKFTYHLAKLDAGRYFDDAAGLGDYDPGQRYGALFVGDDPAAEDLPSEDLFFLKTRLDEFPAADLTEELLFLVQNPLTLAWGNVPLSGIKDWLQDEITAHETPVWSGPWEDYTAGVADYALAASLGRDLYDRVKRIEQNPYDLPIASDTVLGGIKVGAGLVIAEDGTLSVEESASQVALQSLQAQIDSVATRDCFDELLATTIFADQIAVDTAYASRYYLTDDVYFYVEVINGTPCVKLNAPFITDGDQIVQSGTPGGGGGGTGYLSELADVSLTDLTAGQMLQWNGTAWENVAAPTGSIYSVALAAGTADGSLRLIVNGVPDANVAVPGLGSAAFKAATYFALASHTHGISDVTGLNDNLGTISDALQSLQAQIDSVATRDCFDELLATTIFADQMAADTAYASRYYLTHDVYFCVEVVNDVPCVKLNAPFITDGDQIVQSGTPGGGGGGGAQYLSELLDVTITSGTLSTGQVLQWNGSAWVNGSVSGGTQYVPGTGISISENTIAINATYQGYISHGETAYSWGNHALAGYLTSANGTTISDCLQSLQSQIDSAAARTAFDELVVTALYADTISASSGYFDALAGNLTGNVTGNLSGNASTATYATYATCDSASENIASCFGVVSTALQSMQSQIDSVAAHTAFDELVATALYADTLSASNGYFDALTASGGITTTTLTASAEIKSYANGSVAQTYLGISAIGFNRNTDTGAVLQSGIRGGQIHVDGTSGTMLFGLMDTAGTYSSPMYLYRDGGLRVERSDWDVLTLKCTDSSHGTWIKYHGAAVAESQYCFELGCGAWMDYFYLGFISPGGETMLISVSNSGTFSTVGDQVVSSDATLKTNLKDVTYTVEDIAKCRAVTFDWKDGHGHSAGSIAQDWKPIIPELVHGEEGDMTLAYGQIALVNSILLARHETEQDREIRELKDALGEANNKIERLENEVKRLTS